MTHMTLAAAERSFLCWRTSEWAAAGNVVTALLTAFLVWYVSRQVGQAKKEREEATRPYVIVDAHVHAGSDRAYLRIQNNGNTPARNIKFDDHGFEAAVDGSPWLESGVRANGL